MDDGVPFFVPCLFSGFSGIREFLENKRSFRDILSYISGGRVFLSFIITSRKLRIIKEINNKLGEVRILKSSEKSFDMLERIIRRRDGMSKRKVEKYLEKITVSTYREKLFLPSLGIIEIFARVRSIDAASRSPVFVQELMSFSQSRTHPF